ncbi:uncharacterized protein LOC144797970 [Lissotriton helveticus]
MAETSNESSFPPLFSNLKEKMPPEMPVSGTVITAVMSIASITVGSVYFHDCPAQYLIPYYLIISGVSSLLLLIQSILPCRNQEEPSILIVIFHLILCPLKFFITEDPHKKCLIVDGDSNDYISLRIVDDGYVNVVHVD